MLQTERLRIIMDTIDRDSAVTVSGMAQVLKVSESTVRRDIEQLEEAGRLRRVFGGAVSVQPGSKHRIIARESGMAEKNVLHVEEKRVIARYAAALIKDDDFVFIDAGSSTGLMVEELDNREATYVTNGMRHALRLAERGFKVFILSGQAKALTEAASGSLACESMGSYAFSKAFIGANGIDDERGITTPDVEEAIVKNEAIRRAREAYILADHSKFGVVTSVAFTSPESVTVITDRCPHGPYLKTMHIKEVDS